MRKFFSEHPIFATCLTSCSVLLILFTAGTFLLLFLVGLIIRNVPSNYSSTKTESAYTYQAGNQNSSNKFLTIPVKGVILTTEQGTDPFAFLLPNVVFGYSIKEQFSRAANDSSINGVILEVDSPGGTITGSKAISDGIEYYKNQTKKPVYVHISGLGASGGYWAAAAGDQIISDAGSLIGSIGVIMGPFKYFNKVLSEGGLGYSVLTEEGIETFNITAGEGKAIGDPYTRMTERERSVLQQGVNNEYDIFVNHVSSQRNITPQEVRERIGALVYDNRQALELKLIDSVGSREEAYVALAKAANVTEKDFQIVGERATDFWSELFKYSLPFRPLPQNGTCAICSQNLYLYGNPEDYIYKK